MGRIAYNIPLGESAAIKLGLGIGAYFVSLRTETSLIKNYWQDGWGYKAGDKVISLKTDYNFTLTLPTIEFRTGANIGISDSVSLSIGLNGAMVGKGSSIMSEYTTVYYPQGPTTYPPKLDIKTGLGEIGGTSFGGDIGVVVKF